VAAGVTWDTISSNGHLFTYTRDKLFTGGTGTDPIRFAPSGLKSAGQRA
jgi:hypothetical protein